MQVKVYVLTVVCDAGIETVQVFTSEEAAKEVMQDRLAEEIAIAKDADCLDSIKETKYRTVIYYEEGGWLELSIHEDEFYISVDK